MFSSAPTANFSWSPSEPIARAAVQFTDQSTGTDVTSWNWDFGDGGSSSSRNPSYTYTTGGSYQVRLTVTDRCGKVATSQKTVNVGTSVSGTWLGYFRDGIDWDMTLQLYQSGQNVSGEVSLFGVRVNASGSFVGGRLRLSFKFPGDPWDLVLTGDYNASRDSIAGTWSYQGVTWDTWEVVRQ